MHHVQELEDGDLFYGYRNENRIFSSRSKARNLKEKVKGKDILDYIYDEEVLHAKQRKYIQNR